MVSLLIPAYNAEKTIGRCLDSVLTQAVPDMEIIIVNDGSEDNTLQILQGYAQKDARITVIDQPNGGVTAARNTLLYKATGDFILYVDADDWIEPNMLERMLDLLDDADIVSCRFDSAEMPEQVKRINEIKLEAWDHERQLLEFLKHRYMAGMLWNKLIRRSITEGCAFNEKTEYGEDAEFLWQVLKMSQKMIVTNEVLYHHVMDSDSISHLSFSDKKFSAIPMWETVNDEVERDYPELLPFARERLICSALFSLYECKNCAYQNEKQIKHMHSIVRKYFWSFLKSKSISVKFKLYAIAVYLGY